MTDDTKELEELVERSKPPALVFVAAAVLGAEGVLLLLLGLQHVMLVHLAGPVAIAPWVMMGLGVLSLGAAKAFGEARPLAVWPTVALAAVLVLSTGAWVLISALMILFSAFSFLAFALSIASVVMVAIAAGPCRRTAQAAKQLEAMDRARDEAPVDASATPAAALAELGLERRRRGWGLPLAALLVIGAIGAGVVLYMKYGGERNPLRVAVAIGGGIDPAFDGPFRDRVVERLDAYGLDAVAAEPIGAGGDVVAPARAAAAEAGAAHALVMELSSRRERDGVVLGTALFAMTATARLVPVDETAQPRSESMEFAFEGATAGEIASDVSQTWIDALSPSVLDWIFESPSFAPVLEGEVSPSEIPAASKLRELTDAVKLRRTLARQFSEYCALETARIGVLDKAAVRPIHCQGDPCDQITLVGLDAEGRAIAQDISRTPIFPVPPVGRTRWAEPPERVLALSLDGAGEPQELFRAGHFYGFGNVAADGRRVVVQAFGTGGTLALVTLDLPSGARRDASLLMPRERTAWALPAPGAEGVAAELTNGTWLSLAGSQRAELANDFDGAGWVVLEGGVARLAGQLGWSGELALMGPDGAIEDRRLLLPGRLDKVLAGQGPSNQLAMIVETDQGCELLTVDASSPTALAIASQRPLPLCLDTPGLLPDGRLVGTASISADGDVPGDPEVAVVDPATGTATALTSGGLIEETVFPTRDGARVVFGRRLETWPRDYDLRIYRRQVCWVDVPPAAAPAPPATAPAPPPTP